MTTVYNAVRSSGSWISIKSISNKHHLVLLRYFCDFEAVYKCSDLLIQLLTYLFTYVPVSGVSAVLIWWCSWYCHQWHAVWGIPNWCIVECMCLL